MMHDNPRETQNKPEQKEKEELFFFNEMKHNAAEMGQKEIWTRKINRINPQIILNKIP